MTQGVVGLGQVHLDGNIVYWTELRPWESGRTVLVRRHPDGRTEDVTPPPINIRSRVHEYGGASYAVTDGIVFYADGATQRLMRMRPGEDPAALTEEDGSRFADLVVDTGRQRIVTVEEVHDDEGEPVNRLAAVGFDGSGRCVIAQGADFYTAPRLSPDGDAIAWIEWDHPNMPWDGTRLMKATIKEDGSLQEAVCIAGGQSESIFQPEFAVDGGLYFVSDRSGYWNLYRERAGQIEAVLPMQAEFGLPYWQFGMRTYGLLSDDRIVCAYAEEGDWKLGVIDGKDSKLTPLSFEGCGFHDVSVGADGVYLLIGHTDRPESLDRLSRDLGQQETIKSSADLDLPLSAISVARKITFPTAGGAVAHGYFYAPASSAFSAGSNEKPPLIVRSHGGPTGQTDPSFSLKIQYWASRGFAVFDVNYRGSTGYGRAYREQLDGRWGLADVEDCVHGAQFLAEKGLADPDRLIIAGGSAGGYTTLCALTFTSAFKAGASHYGVGDLEALAKDTHKFESRYLDRLIGRWPEDRQIYHERSPIFFVDRLQCPVIFLQGEEDRVVPPNQAETMVDALERKGLPVAFVLFPGEGHGFRQAENIKRALESELSFYGQVFGFEPSGIEHAVEVRNHDDLDDDASS